jgi:putative ABC transport system permease protein
VTEKESNLGGGSLLETAWQDVLYGLRLLRRSPLFTLTAVASLAIGLGANIAIFSVASALLMRPLPGIADPGRLVDIGRTRQGVGFNTTSYPNYVDLRARTTTLAGVYAWRAEPEPMSLGGRDGAERVYGTRVTGNYFAIVGTRAERGRLFADGDDTPGHNDVTVISDELWRRRFGADESTLGSTITVTGRPYVVVGVAPRGFQGTTILKADLWLPLSTQPGAGTFTDRRITWLVMGGRLKPGVTLAQANAEVSAIGGTLAREYPSENKDRGLRVAQSSIFPGRINVIAQFVGLLMAIAGLVLLIACVNLAGMLLARAAARRREIAVRMAIGAGRTRLVRQLLTETGVLFAAGCGAGLLLGRWFVDLLLAVLPQLPLPIAIDIAVDWRVRIFAIAVTVITAVLCGLAPALHVSGISLIPGLKSDAADSGRDRLRLRQTFLVGQIALSLLLVIAAALFVRALQHAGRIDPGFDQTGVDAVTLNLSLARLDEQQGLTFLRALETRARALPDVAGVVSATDLPLDGDRMSFGDARLPGTPRDTDRNAAPVDWNLVTPGFFTTLRVGLLRGRDFTDHDGPNAPAVVIVNATLARRFWGDADPIGRRIQIDGGFSSTPSYATVIGVAADAQFVALGERTPYLYAPLAQHYHPRVSLLVRTAGPTAIPAVRALVREMNPNLPIVAALPLRDVTAIGLVPQRIAAAVAGTLGMLGLLLAALGIYGVTSYGVTRRTCEIGIRIALGARRGEVTSLILRQSASVTLWGTAVGLVLAVVGSRVLGSLLLGVSVVDPLAFGGSALLFVGIAAVASCGPVLRASRVDPVAALRSE